MIADGACSECLLGLAVPVRGASDPSEILSACLEASVGLVCRCSASYPARLRELSGPPAVIFHTGPVERMARLASGPAVAVVGSRRASAHGREVARAIAGRLAGAGVTVISGLAAGIDAAAHAAALDSGHETLAVLPVSVSRAGPAPTWALYRRIVALGTVVSELPPGVCLQRWMFPARNRLIAALGQATVVVEAPVRSGALITARLAAELGRPVAAVPAGIGSARAAGSNRLIAGGARILCAPEEALELLSPASGAEAVAGPAPPGRGSDRTCRSLDRGGDDWLSGGREPPALDRGPALSRRLTCLIDEIDAGRDTPEALGAAGHDPARLMAALAELELAGRVRRAPGGRLVVTM